jgi:DNA-3-methyladenine glycosylase II
LRRRLIVLAGAQHSAGLCCYPDAAHLARLSEDELRSAGFSATKAHTLLTVGQRVAAGELPLDDWLAAPPVEVLRERLLAIRGIGPWTVDYTLLRGFGWLDGSLHGDAAVRRGLQLLSGASQAPDEKETRAWLAPFAPWRALLAAHLWALQAVKA